MINVDSSDLVRGPVGLSLIAIPFMFFNAFLVGWGGWKLLALMGVVLLGTAAIRLFPLYAIRGANTRATERH